MSFKKTLIFLIFLALLGTYYYVYEVKIGEQKEKAAQEAKKAFAMTKEEVKEFTLSKEDKLVVTAQKVDGNWRITQPVETAADQTTMAKFVEELSEAKVDKIIDEEPKDLSPFGLNKPSLTVSFQTDKIKGILFLGQKNVTGTFIYGQREGEKKVLFLYASLSSSLDKSLFDLRDKSIFNFKNQEVDTLEVVHNNVTMVAKQDKERDWSLAGPFNYKADSEHIDGLLLKLTNERIKEFVSESSQDLKPYGLDNPLFRINVSLKDNKEKKTLLIGLEKPAQEKDGKSKYMPNQDKGSSYAKIEGESPVFLISTEISTAFPRKINDLRDRRLVTLDRSKTQKVRLEGKENVELVKEEPQKKDALEEWKLTEPIKEKTDLAKVGHFLYVLRELKVKDFIEDKPANLVLYGLEKPKATISYWEQGDEKPKSLLIGNDVPNKNEVFIKMSGNDAVYTMGKETEKDLLVSAFEFQYRTILDVKLDKVKHLEIKYPNSSINLVREKQQWKIPSEEAKANDGKIWDLLWSFTDLKYQGIFKSDQIKQEELGFDNPQVVITLEDEGKQTEVLTIGKRLDGQPNVYLRVKSKDTIYAIEEKFLEMLPKKPSDLLG